MLAQSFTAKVVFGREDRQLNKVGADRYFLFWNVHLDTHPAPFAPEAYLLPLLSYPVGYPTMTHRTQVHHAHLD
jgi:hypothetical protein